MTASLSVKSCMSAAPGCVTAVYPCRAGGPPQFAEKARAAQGVGERPEALGIQRAGQGDLASEELRPPEPGRHRPLDGQGRGERIPGAVPQRQLALQDELEGGAVLRVHAHHAWRVVVFVRLHGHGPRALDPPLVHLGDLARLALAGHGSPVLEEGMALVRDGGLDQVAQPEVADVGEELGLSPQLAADEDGLLLVDRVGERILALDTVVGGGHVGHQAQLRLGADGEVVDREADLGVACRHDAGRQEGRNALRIGRVGDLQHRPVETVARDALWSAVSHVIPAASGSPPHRGGSDPELLARWLS